MRVYLKKLFEIQTIEITKFLAILSKLETCIMHLAITVAVNGLSFDIYMLIAHAQSLFSIQKLWTIIMLLK